MLKCLIDPDVPVNSGFYRNVHMIAPAGTVVNCTAPAPVVGGWETQLRLTEVMLKALAEAIPEKVPAGTEGMICHSGFGGFDPYRNETYCFLGDHSRRLRRTGHQVTAQMPCSPTAKTPPTRRSKRRNSTIRYALPATN